MTNTPKPQGYLLDFGHEYDIAIDSNGQGVLNDISSRFCYKGVVPDYASLPTNASNGDVYYVTGSTGNYWYNDNHWEALGTGTVTVPIDTALSATSSNPVQNKAIYSKISSLEAKDTSQDSKITALETVSNNAYTSSGWDESTRILTLTHSSGTQDKHYISKNGNDAGILTFTLSDGTTITKNVITSSGTPYDLYFELADGTIVTKTIVSTTTG